MALLDYVEQHNALISSGGGTQQEAWGGRYGYGSTPIPINSIFREMKWDEHPLTSYFGLFWCSWVGFDP